MVFRLLGRQASSFKHGPICCDLITGRNYTIVGTNTRGWSSCSSEVSIEGVNCSVGWVGESLRISLCGFWKTLRLRLRIDELKSQFMSLSEETTIIDQKSTWLYWFMVKLSLMLGFKFKTSSIFSLVIAFFTHCGYYWCDVVLLPL